MELFKTEVIEFKVKNFFYSPIIGTFKLTSGLKTLTWINTVIGFASGLNFELN